jgi:hypothetical protein
MNLKILLWVVLLTLLVAGCGFLVNAQQPTPLFSCETNRAGKYLSIYGIEHGPDEPWTDVQYRFGAEGKPEEMVYPDDPSLGAQSIFFSHEYLRSGAYHVSLRFVSRGFTYKIFSNAIDERGDGNAGVIITDSRGRVRDRVACIERPYMLIAYLQRTLACDLKNPHGKAACGVNAYRPRR